MARELEGKGSAGFTTPLMRLQDPQYTKIILVTLPQTTPVLQAEALQQDLRRARIEPYAWVINKSILASGTRDPLLVARTGSPEAGTRASRVKPVRSWAPLVTCRISALAPAREQPEVNCLREQLPASSGHPRCA